MKLLSAWMCLLGLLSASAAYRPLEAPQEWHFTAPSPAFHPETGEKLGDFQPGIRVKVLEEQWEEDRWLVVYQRYGAPDIQARVPIPDMTAGKERLAQSAEKALKGFPILHEQLKADRPWPEAISELAQRHLSEGLLEAGTLDEPQRIISAKPAEDGLAWGIRPLLAAIDYTEEGNPRIVFELWNKADAYRSNLRPDKAHEALQEQLDDLERLFGTHRGMSAREVAGSGITAVRDPAERYFLPNDTVATLRYQNGEYLILELSSFRAKGKESSVPSYDPDTFAQNIRARVKETDEGHRYVSGVPMISQGDKGYCAAATLARVLNYYGYPVDMHALADLAETERTGTSKDNIIRSMRRVCASTPFRMDELDTRRRNEILEVIESGLPIIWLVPGHMRLLIGVHPDGDVVYSDSWGPGHEFKTMGWNKFTNLNEAMYVLRPQ